MSDPLIVHKHQEVLDKLNLEISNLIEKRWQLFMDDANSEEVREAYISLTDDPGNTINDLMDWDSAVGKWLIPDEVMAVRQMKEEEEEEQNDGHTM